MARRREVVVDSTVAVKWFSRENKTNEALALRDSHVKGLVTLLATPLLSCELANALRYKPDYDKDKLSEAMKYFFGLHLRQFPIDATLLSLASEIAFRGDLTIYDAVPVALARLTKTTCMTADKDIQYEKLRPKGYPIELL